jgi:hypothetical protein
MRRLGTLIVFTVLLFPVTSQEIESSVFPPEVFRYLSSIDQARAPEVMQDHVVFTFDSERFVRYVAIAFEHEEFQERHVFSVRPGDDNGEVFYYVYPVDRDLDRLRYRLIVDGVWIADPYVERSVIDRRGIAMSEIDLLERPVREFRGPVVHDDGRVEFRFAYDFRVSGAVETLDGRRISIGNLPAQAPVVVGSFNAWDPFVHRMSPLVDNSDLYSLELRLPPGDYYYYYLVAGERILDPTNPNTGRDVRVDQVVNRVTVPDTAE